MVIQRYSVFSQTHLGEDKFSEARFCMKLMILASFRRDQLTLWRVSNGLSLWTLLLLLWASSTSFARCRLPRTWRQENFPIIAHPPFLKNDLWIYEHHTTSVIPSMVHYFEHSIFTYNFHLHSHDKTTGVSPCRKSCLHMTGQHKPFEYWMTQWT